MGKKRRRICIWATTMQANVFSLARYFSRNAAVELVVVVQNLNAYLNEYIHILAPLNCTIFDREDPMALSFLKKWKPDVTVIDNHYPPKPLSPLLVNVWHGFGWKGPEDKAQFAEVHKSIKKFTRIAADRTNPHLMWISAGETNRQYRIDVTGFHPDNVFAMGQCYTDDVTDPPFTREQALAFYPRSFHNRKICLFAPTWHFGKIFSHWGDDLAIIESLCSELAAMNAALILRMHDRKRFDPSYLKSLERLSEKADDAVLIKFKDDQQDNLMDMTVAECMLSNYSSMLTFFYGTGKPSIHIYPVKKGQEVFFYRIWKNGKVRELKAIDQSYIWSLPPEETGGIIANTPSEMLAQLKLALTDSKCCRDKARSFIDRHCAPYDGRRCELLAAAIEARLAVLGF